MVAVSAALSILGSLNESLWLDELHSTWSATGSFEEVAPRAALGNQLPPYFWYLWAVGHAFGPGEAVWRLPSVIAWTLLIVLGSWTLWRWTRQWQRPVIIATITLALSDRSQIFYATEARPYALVALLNLLAWLALSRWCFGSSSTAALRSARDDDLDAASASLDGSGSWRAWTSWLCLDVLAFWMQPTVVLSILAQLIFVSGWWCVRLRRLTNRDSRVRRLVPILLAGLILSLSMWPARHVLGPAWQHRQEWASFASGHSLENMLRVLPLAAVLGPLLLGLSLKWLIARIVAPQSAPEPIVDRHRESALATALPGPSGRSSRVQEGDTWSVFQWWLWTCAWSVPCLSVWLMSAAGIVPLVHQRYLFASAMPLVLWTAYTLARIDGRGWRLAILLGIFATLSNQQESARQWLSGGVPIAVRGEDWRGAVQWIRAQGPSDARTIVYCASNLIEGDRAAIASAHPSFQEYLALPLASIYALPPHYHVVPLPNNPRQWPRSISAHPSAPPAVAATWLIVRASPAGFERRARASGLKVDIVRDFGGVQVARLVR